MSPRTTGRPAATSGGGRPAGPTSRRPAGASRPGRAAGPTSDPSGLRRLRPARLVAVGAAAGIVVGLVAGVLLVPLLPGVGDRTPVTAVGGADTTSHQAGSSDQADQSKPTGAAARVQARAEQLRAEAAVRDDEAFEELVRGVEALGAELAPVVEAAALHSGQDAPAPDAATAAGWSATVAEARAGFDGATSAGTDVNVARAAVAASLLDLQAATGAFEQAAAAADTGGDPTGPLTTGGTALRAAVATWAVGATQLDAVSVARDNGHLHVFLPAVEGSGALTADPEVPGAAAPEDAHPESEHTD